jgi:hypothetical protein
MSPDARFGRNAPDSHAAEDQAVCKVVSLFMDPWNGHPANVVTATPTFQGYASQADPPPAAPPASFNQYFKSSKIQQRLTI